jgi:hypothetical protein
VVVVVETTVGLLDRAAREAVAQDQVVLPLVRQEPLILAVAAAVDQLTIIQVAAQAAPA